MIYIHTPQVTRTQFKSMGGVLMKFHETIKKVGKYSNSIKKGLDYSSAHLELSDQ